MLADITIVPIYVGGHVKDQMLMELVIDGEKYTSTINKSEAKRMKEKAIIQPVTNEGKTIYKSTH